MSHKPVTGIIEIYINIVSIFMNGVQLWKAEVFLTTVIIFKTVRKNVRKVIDVNQVYMFEKNEV